MTRQMHEMCVQKLTRYTLFKSFIIHNIAIITHVFCHETYDLKQVKIGKNRASDAQYSIKYVYVFLACGGVLGHGVVRLHKSVQKVLTHVLQPVHGHADGMK